jgi:hypothetical protein
MANAVDVSDPAKVTSRDSPGMVESQATARGAPSTVKQNDLETLRKIASQRSHLQNALISS